MIMDQKGITDIEIHKFNYLWTINNFSYGLKTKLQKNEALVSPNFTFGENNNLVWCLKLTKYDNSKDYSIFLALRFLSSDKKEVRAGYTFSVINETGQETCTVNTETTYDFGPESEKSNRLFNVSTVLDKAYGLLPDDKLTIVCKVYTLGDISSKSSTMKFQIPECRLLEDFGMLFETKQFSDVTLEVADGKQFQVHKNILAARSPVFAAMFEHEMKERKHHHVNITDVDYEVLHQLLKFIYTGKVENLEIMAGEMLSAADKYDLERLKVLCEKELYTNLSIENAVEILVLADLHKADQLKAQAIHFIHNNPEVIDSKGWEQEKTAHLGLFAEIYESLVIHKLSS